MTSRTREGLRTGSNSLARRFVTRCGRDVDQARIEDSASNQCRVSRVSHSHGVSDADVGVAESKTTSRCKIASSGRSAFDLANPVEIQRSEREPASGAGRLAKR